MLQRMHDWEENEYPGLHNSQALLELQKAQLATLHVRQIVPYLFKLNPEVQLAQTFGTSQRRQLLIKQNGEQVDWSIRR